MKILATPIPNGSHGVLVWVEVPPGDTDTGEPYQFACNLCRLDDDTCEVTQAIGDLSDDVAVLIGLEVIELGYKRLELRVTAGTRVSRWLTYWKTEGGMDYYTCDLMQSLAQLEGRG